MRNLHKAAVAAALAGIVGLGVSGAPANAADTAPSKAFQQAAAADSESGVAGTESAWPVMAARIAYLGARHAASTPVVRSTAGQVLRSAGGIFGIVPAVQGGALADGASVDEVFDR